ncbi:MAG TPA: esterase [Turneriella sp.]|nr:esterase [Turneriella sp.]
MQQQLRYIERFVDGIRVIEIPGAPDAPTFFCMHGYGANAFDLAGLSQHLAFPSSTRYLFPDGILGVDAGFGNGRAWFPIDWVEIERIRREGGLRDLSKNLPLGMAEAREKVIGLLTKLSVDIDKTVIGGFSQGAMMATEILLSHRLYFKGLILFSGTLVNRVGWQQLLQKKFMEQNKKLQFIQSHGRFDPVLPFQAAEWLNQLLNDDGGRGELVAFDGQHEIPASVVEATNRWLQSSL